MNIQQDEIYTFKITSGEELVARVSSVGENFYLLTKPLSVGMGPQGLHMMPSVFTADPDSGMQLNAHAVTLITETRSEIKNSYIEATTGIQVAAKSNKILMG